MCGEGLWSLLHINGVETSWAYCWSYPEVSCKTHEDVGMPKHGHSGFLPECSKRPSFILVTTGMTLFAYPMYVNGFAKFLGKVYLIGILNKTMYHQKFLECSLFLSSLYGNLHFPQGISQICDLYFCQSQDEQRKKSFWNLCWLFRLLLSVTLQLQKRLAMTETSYMW